MGFLSTLTNSFRKSKRLRRISVKLDAGPPPADNLLQWMMHRANLAKEAEDELFALVEDDPVLSLIMQRQKANRETLRNVYHMLLTAGAGQWERGHWVPASALAFGSTLEYCLSISENADKNKWDEAAYQMLDYF